MPVLEKKQSSPRKPLEQENSMPVLFLVLLLLLLMVFFCVLSIGPGTLHGSSSSNYPLPLTPWI